MATMDSSPQPRESGFPIFNATTETPITIDMVNEHRDEDATDAPLEGESTLAQTQAGHARAPAEIDERIAEERAAWD